MAVVSVAEPVEAAFFCSKISSTSNSIFSIIGLFCGVVGGISSTGYLSERCVSCPYLVITKVN